MLLKHKTNGVVAHAQVFTKTMQHFKADLFCKNIVNNCGGFENAQHLFFSCPLYAGSRSNLSIRLEIYSINQLLHGIEDTTLQEKNKTLFIAVHRVYTF